MLPACPECGSDYTYEDGTNFVCPMCHHEWQPHEAGEYIVRDANGNQLMDGDSITVIKDLKVKGTSSSIKQGTKVKNIRLTEPDNGHNIDCKVDGFGQISLKSEFVKKL